MTLGLSCLETCGILVPRPGIEPLCSALQDGFLIIGPLGKYSAITVLMYASHFKMEKNAFFTQFFPLQFAKVLSFAKVSAFFLETAKIDAGRNFSKHRSGFQ